MRVLTQDGLLPPGIHLADWDHKGVGLARLDPILLTFDSGRAAQKIKFGGELFPANSAADPSSASPFIRQQCQTLAVRGSQTWITPRYA
jgi:hypothetical protein